ncbi:hypothetical protein MSAN_02276500 [Mycena sanguinolenta]|uniref:Uncharacterized protein n=1 Tax=Mycena sanguinolenta TaxID=230812 RepID=A0A8H7CH62_9AGAR|nr:hypothetical protein MSAN_02276500 [Mycena sanguinolenta]
MPAGGLKDLRRSTSVQGGVYPAWCSPLPVIVPTATCTAFEVAEIVADEWDVAVERIFIKDVYHPHPEVCASQHCRAERATARLMRQAARVPRRCRSSDSKQQVMAKSGNSADAAAVGRLASGW